MSHEYFLLRSARRSTDNKFPSTSLRFDRMKETIVPPITVLVPSEKNMLINKSLSSSHVHGIRAYMHRLGHVWIQNWQMAFFNSEISVLRWSSITSMLNPFIYFTIFVPYLYSETPVVLSPQSRFWEIYFDPITELYKAVLGTLFLSLFVVPRLLGPWAYWHLLCWL